MVNTFFLMYLPKFILKFMFFNINVCNLNVDRYLFQYTIHNGHRPEIEERRNTG
jgi:hypothetical protein